MAASAVDLALPRLQNEEGFRALPYQDMEGHTTIGYGCNLTVGLTQRAALALLNEQASEIDEQLSKIDWYAGLDQARRSVCLDIAYNAGVHGLLGFPHMIAALARGDWSTAASECHVENPELASRYSELAQILRTGVA